MLCQDCAQKAAIIHFVSDINGEHQDLKLCADCARKRRQAFSGAMSFAINMNDLLAGFYKPTPTEETAGLACPECGMTLMELQQSAKLGCAACYGTFHEWLEPVMRRIHGRTEHQGKIPGRSGAGLQLRRRIDELKKRQQAAIFEERFESAAELRDQIRALELELTHNEAEAEAMACAEGEGCACARENPEAEGAMPSDATTSAPKPDATFEEGLE